MSLKQFVRFTTDSAFQEKTLRMLENISSAVAACVVTAEDVKTWLLLRRQFALGRRYYRCVKWIDCLNKSYDLFYKEQSLITILEVGKWTSLAILFFLEALNILDCMGVWETDFAKQMLIEANKFWFYAQIFAMLGGIMQLSASNRVLSDTLSKLHKEKERSYVSSDKVIKAQKKAEAKLRDQRATLRRRLVVDGLDLLTPGRVVGWIPTPAATLGIATAISCLLAMKDIWDKNK